MVVAAGFAALAVWGVDAHNEAAFNWGGVAEGAGPLARWDSVWFLEIAQAGYDDSRGAAEEAAFFPLYPLLLRLTGSTVAGGVIVSVGCFAGALWLLHRLVARDFGEDVARLSVLLLALFPGALFFSAVYSESLFLLLSVGAVYAARTGRWEVAAGAGALAAATRSAGLLLLVPLAVLWWQAGRPRRGLWVAAVPLGLVAYCAWLEGAAGDWSLVFDAQAAWHRSLAVPLVDPVRDAWEGASQIARGEERTWPVFDTAWFDVGLFALLLLALAALAGAARRLPPAYSAYAACALALPLLFPADGQALMSLPRFLAVVWPLHLWLAVVLVRRRGPRMLVLGAFAVGLAAASAEFATWGWVA